MPERTTPDAYYAGIPEHLSEAATGLRSLVFDAASDFREVIKWGSPVYERDKPVLWIKAHTNHLSLGFFRGAELADPESLLEGTGKSMRHLKIRSAELVARSSVRDLIDAAIQLDASSR